jgi:hypothetical protein
MSLFIGVFMNVCLYVYMNVCVCTYQRDEGSTEINYRNVRTSEESNKFFKINLVV